MITGLTLCLKTRHTYHCVTLPSLLFFFIEAGRRLSPLSSVSDNLGNVHKMPRIRIKPNMNTDRLISRSCQKRFFVLSPYSCERCLPRFAHFVFADVGTPTLCDGSHSDRFESSIYSCARDRTRLVPYGVSSARQSKPDGSVWTWRRRTLYLIGQLLTLFRCIRTLRTKCRGKNSRIQRIDDQVIGFPQVFQMILKLKIIITNTHIFDTSEFLHDRQHFFSKENEIEWQHINTAKM